MAKPADKDDHWRGRLHVGRTRRRRRRDVGHAAFLKQQLAVASSLTQTDRPLGIDRRRSDRRRRRTNVRSILPLSGRTVTISKSLGRYASLFFSSGRRRTHRGQARP
jgi:hypothetical protein